MTPIAELRALLSAGTKGPWIDWGARVSTAYPSRDPMDDGEPLQIADCDVDVRIDYDTTGQVNAALIVAAVNSLEALLDRVEALEAALKRIQSEGVPAEVDDEPEPLALAVAQIMVLRMIAREALGAKQ